MAGIEPDRDPITDELVPCVMCGMSPQRGGTGCCSAECEADLAAAYPEPPLSWTDPSAMDFLLALRARLERGEQPTERDKIMFQSLAKSLADTFNLLEPIFKDWIEALGGFLKEVVESLPKELLEEIRREADREELHSKGIPLPQKIAHEGVVVNTLLGTDSFLANGVVYPRWGAGMRDEDGLRS